MAYENHIKRPPRKLAIFVMCLLGIFGLFEVIGMITVGSEIRLLQRAADGQSVSRAAIEANDARRAVFSSAYSLFFLFTAVMFCIWLNLASKTVRCLRGGAMEFSPGWTVGWFFVPIAHLWKPYQAVRELWKASEPTAIGEKEFYWRQNNTPALLPLWWASWLISNFLSYASWNFYSDAQSAQAVLTADWIEIAAGAAGIPCTILALFLVRGINQRQCDQAGQIDAENATIRRHRCARCDKTVQEEEEKLFDYQGQPVCSECSEYLSRVEGRELQQLR